MADDPGTVGAAPWYTSKVQIAQITSLVSALIVLFPKLGSALGLNTLDEVNTTITTVFAFIAVAAPLVGMIFRAKSTIQPLTLTQAKADAHPATLEAKKP